jgi:hypothetical protein
MLFSEHSHSSGLDQQEPVPDLFEKRGKENAKPNVAYSSELGISATSSDLLLFTSTEGLAKIIGKIADLKVLSNEN